MLIVTLVGLTVMRGDAGRLVLDPLQRMLKIVIRCKFEITVRLQLAVLTASPHDSLFSRC